MATGHNRQRLYNALEHVLGSTKDYAALRDDALVLAQEVMSRIEQDKIVDERDRRVSPRLGRWDDAARVPARKAEGRVMTTPEDAFSREPQCVEFEDGSSAIIHAPRWEGVVFRRHVEVTRPEGVTTSMAEQWWQWDASLWAAAAIRVSRESGGVYMKADTETALKLHRAYDHIAREWTEYGP